MKIILKEDVQSLGEAGDVITVKDGFARNYLLPQDFAEKATAGALKNREKNLATIKPKAEKVHQANLETAKKIEAIEVLELSAKAGETGKLYGAITTKKLAELILERSEVEVDRRNISLDRPINQIGEYTLLAKLSSKVEVKLPVVVKAEAEEK